jgi:peptidoglycan/xylan/chitin deacetylase (PgdA/CDA1 family)
MTLLLTVGFSVAGDEAVVLMYHRFGQDRYPSTSVRLERFDAHLEHLASAGYAVVPLADVVACLKGEGDLPKGAVAITIDDAYRSVYTEAYPRLKARGWPFTVFVATDPVDQGLSDYMTWEQMREMAGHGATYANHGASHDSMVGEPHDADDAVQAKRVRADIEKARRRLSEELSPLPAIFAYPYGEYDEVAAGVVEDLGFIAFGQHSGALGPTSDRRALPRYPINEAYSAMDDFRMKMKTRPLPVTQVEPWDPVIATRSPRLELTLRQTDARLDALACFVGGQGQVKVEWLEPGRRFAVQPPEALSAGRNRVNCTAPAKDGGRYHWFSHQWIVLAK